MDFESIQELFSASVARFGPLPAIEVAETVTTYDELEARSNRLAAVLQERGAAPGTRVAIAAAGVSDVVAALLGVLKVRCVFVPFDLGTPEARLAAMLAQAEPDVVVADEAGRNLLGPLGEGLDGRFVSVEELAPGATPGEDRRVLLRPDPDDPCYVYFTSGSTGVPKGIVGRLKGIDHFVRWEIETFGIGEGARVSQLTSPAFDAFLRDVFVPLCAGGTICAPPSPDTVPDARRLVAWLEEARVELVHCVPSLLRSILGQDLTPESFPALERVLLAGEPLLPADVARWSELFGRRIELVNLYGPSETTMVKLFYRVRPEDAGLVSIPIGRPMKGAAALVLDGRDQARGVGQVGEIVIRTPYRSHGYLRHPELTEELFVPNPFTGDPEDLVYRTGDLGRMLPGGDIEFLGRRDHQVKVRGVRVELGEVEAALLRHPAVREAAVAPHDAADGNKLLCAYLVLGEAVEPRVLREHLSAILPEAMIPSAFVVLDELPRTLSGKVDRRALPPPDTVARLQEDYVAPRTPVEEVLADIWAEMLRLERVGIHDDFFQLGGHSLLATRALARLRQALDVDLPLRVLFRAPTVAGLGEAVEEEMQRTQGLRIPPLVRRPDDGEPPLSFAQQRLWFMDQAQPLSSFYNVVAAVRLTGELSLPALRRACDEIVRRHESLRTVFVLRGDEPVQVVSGPAPLELPVEDLRPLPAGERWEQAVRRVSAEADRPFDLARGPLVRCRLLRLADDDHVMTVVLHHIIADGWSLGLFIREVVRLYGSFSREKPSPLPELPVQYADFAVWQRGWLQGEELASQLGYWVEHLADAPALIALPTDHPRPPVQTFRGDRRSAMLPAELTDRLRELSRGEGCTLFMALLAAFQTLLHLETEEKDVLVGSPVSYRNWAEVEGLIGFFANTLVFRGDLSGDPTFRELLARTRRVSLDAFAHQHLPFHLLVEALRPERSLAHSPIFQVGFTFQPATAETPLEVPGLRADRFDFEVETTQFDLNLSVAETSEGLSAVLQYSRDLFDELRIDWMLDSYRELLEQVASEPDLRLGELRERLGEAESRRLREVRSSLQRESTETFRSRVRRTVVVAGPSSS